MKDRTELVRGWLRKARSDEVAVDALIDAGALDAACFHAQQAVEKYLKSFLIYQGIVFPFTHNLAKLIEFCERADPAFQRFMDLAAALTPYAVELRYDDQFWPTEKTANEARTALQSIRDFVLEKFPIEIKNKRS